MKRIVVSLVLPLASLLACSLPADAQDVPSAYRGIWKQESISCTGETPEEPVRELEFLTVKISKKKARRSSNIRG